MLMLDHALVLRGLLDQPNQVLIPIACGKFEQST
jgi:hypothetical protein